MIKKTFQDFKLMLERRGLSDKLDNSTLELNTGLWNKHKDFLSKFHSALEELPGPSWTKIATTHSRYDSESIWHDIYEALKDSGLTWNDVLENKKVIIDNIEEYSSLNAYVDVILYNLDKSYPVGGWSDDVKDNPEEIVIKYRYGYHETTYGIIFIKRYWGSVEEFIKKYAENILYLFLQDTGCIGYSDRKEVFPEIEEYNGLVDWKSPILTIYFDQFYPIVRPYLVSGDVHKVDIEKFKSFFMNWLHNCNNGLEMEDYDDHIEVDFSCDL